MRLESISINKRKICSRAALCRVIIIICALSPYLAESKEKAYTLLKANLRKGQGTEHPIIKSLLPFTVLTAHSTKGKWWKLETLSGQIGYIHVSLLSNRWISVIKKDRLINLFQGDSLLKTFPIALGFNSLDDKIKRGDGSTPEGRFFICEMLGGGGLPSKYGARSMRLSYPNTEDARRGLKDKLINKQQYIAIHRAISQGIKPPQNTRLGGSIRIHGGGVGQDWTLGCIAMNDKDIIWLYDQCPKQGVLVEVYKDKAQRQLMNDEGLSGKLILTGAKNLFKAPILYTQQATHIIKMAFPFGDIDPTIGVCTDVVIRAMRHSGIDLQSFLYEDILSRPRVYKNISRPNTNIDHRRTRNLKKWFDHHSKTLENQPPQSSKNSWLPGDIVLMDTGINNGTIYDHIGIISDKSFQGRPLVINLWTIGSHLEEMDLLKGEYPKLVGHYRIGALINYGVTLGKL